MKTSRLSKNESHRCFVASANIPRAFFLHPSSARGINNLILTYRCGGLKGISFKYSPKIMTVQINCHCEPRRAKQSQMSTRLPRRFAPRNDMQFSYLKQTLSSTFVILIETSMTKNIFHAEKRMGGRFQKKQPPCDFKLSNVPISLHDHHIPRPGVTLPFPKVA